MTTTTSPITNDLFFIPRSFRRAWRFHRLLTVAVVLHLLTVPYIVIGMIVAPKMINGVNGWLQPLKFAFSFGMYAFTFAWLLTYIKGHRVWVQTAATVTAIAALAETGLITMQTTRGVASFFNVATRSDIVVFGLMGGFIFALALMNLLVAVFLIFQKMESRVFAWGLRLGVLISFIGMIVGFVMTLPTGEQVGIMLERQPIEVLGSHAVGDENVGAGVPFFGWNTAGGDLRVAHFFSLHALQVVPITGWVLTREWTRRFYRERERYALMWAVGLAYLGFVLQTIWQAFRGQSIVAPDGWTWLSYAVLGGGVLIVLGGVTWRAGSRTRIRKNADGEMKEKVVLVTGASSGLGKVMATALAREGYRVYGTSRRVREDFDGVRMRVLDVTDGESVTRFVEGIVAEVGQIDVLVNNAGEALSGLVEEVGLDSAESHFQTNFFGAARVTNAVLPLMREQQSGKIIFISSLAGVIGIPGEGYYAASKHALEGYAETLALEVAQFGIDVSLIEPSFFKTGLMKTSCMDGAIADYDAVRELVHEAFAQEVAEGESPQRVADLVVAVVESDRPKLRYRIGRDAVIMPYLLAFTPRRSFAKVMRKRFGLLTN